MNHKFLTAFACAILALGMTACDDDDSSKENKDEATCTPRCDGDNAISCQDGKEVSTKCDNGCDDATKLCKENKDDKGDEATCTPRCDGDSAISCNDGKEVSTKCDNGCDDATKLCKDAEADVFEVCPENYVFYCQQKYGENASCAIHNDDEYACILKADCKLGETKKECNPYYTSLDTLVCSAMSDGSTFWLTSSYEDCDYSCPSGQTACGGKLVEDQGSTCDDSYVAKCTGNIASACSSENTVIAVNCPEYMGDDNFECATINGNTNCYEKCAENTSTTYCSSTTSYGTTYYYQAPYTCQNGYFLADASEDAEIILCEAGCSADGKTCAPVTYSLGSAEGIAACQEENGDDSIAYAINHVDAGCAQKCDTIGADVSKCQYGYVSVSTCEKIEDGLDYGMIRNANSSSTCLVGCNADNTACDAYGESTDCDPDTTEVSCNTNGNTAIVSCYDGWFGQYTVANVCDEGTTCHVFDIDGSKEAQCTTACTTTDDQKTQKCMTDDDADTKSTRYVTQVCLNGYNKADAIECAAGCDDATGCTKTSSNVEGTSCDVDTDTAKCDANVRLECTAADDASDATKGVWKAVQDCHYAYGDAFACVLSNGDTSCVETCKTVGETKVTCDVDYGYYQEYTCTAGDGGVNTWVEGNYNECSSGECKDATSCKPLVEEEGNACDNTYKEKCLAADGSAGIDYAVYCYKNKVTAMNCAGYEGMCLTYSGVTNCYYESGKCDTLGEGGQKCISSYTSNYTCKKDDTNTYTYYVETGENGHECALGCNDAGTDCAE